MLRYRLMNGESGALWPVGDGRYEGGRGWAECEPIVNRIHFDTNADGRPAGLTWERVGEKERTARIADLPHVWWRQARIAIRLSSIGSMTPCRL